MGPNATGKVPGTRKFRCCHRRSVRQVNVKGLSGGRRRETENGVPGREPSRLGRVDRGGPVHEEETRVPSYGVYKGHPENVRSTTRHPSTPLSHRVRREGPQRYGHRSVSVACPFIFSPSTF